MTPQRRHNLPPLLLDRARQLRRSRIPAEMMLWRCLRNRQLGGFKFRRNQPLAPFIADFFCAEVSLVVELDGGSHGPRIIYDARRTDRLNRDGNAVIRFANEDVIHHLDAVLEEILAECEMRRERDG
jgi:very-short-patch-repair endonuclease